jgi:hypothetical protein
MIYNVIAVGRPGSGAEQGRGIQVADAELGQVRHQGRAILQGETFVEL